ncbi:HAD-like protein [Trichodelitschia bisporula]|uniref:HAD-like protein n=1 Tax=Trichodelitschia bisporula TaxID=703511 RepID=A0A6G1I6V9_9PEZI|nr:HAD-like protein [Trichodelitschia bisporula]
MSTTTPTATVATLLEPTTRHPRPRRFKALNPALRTAGKDGGEELAGVVFDVDGTLCEPQNYMFAQMRAALGIPRTTDILDHIYALPTPEAQETAMAAVRTIESEAMAVQRPQIGLLELMGYLEGRGMRKGICTRNFETPVAHLIETFMPGTLFEPIITREFRPPKPHPAGILHIAAQWGLPSAHNLIMVGDSIDDMTAGYRAGAATVLLVNEANKHLAEHVHTDLIITRLDELIAVLDGGFVGRQEGPEDVKVVQADIVKEKTVG